MRYYFIYYLNDFGELTYCSLAEDSGYAIGGEQRNVVRRFPITKHEFSLPLKTLAARYPLEHT